MTDDPTYTAESLHTPESRERDVRLVGHEVKADTSKDRVERHCNKIIAHVHDGRALWDSDLGGIIDTLRALLAEREALEAEVAERHASQSYTYIGKDGKPILARDLEDERDALEAKNQRLREALTSIASNSCCDRCQEAALVARAALKGDSHD